VISGLHSVNKLQEGQTSALHSTCNINTKILPMALTCSPPPTVTTVRMNPVH